MSIPPPTDIYICVTGFRITPQWLVYRVNEGFTGCDLATGQPMVSNSVHLYQTGVNVVLTFDDVTMTFRPLSHPQYSPQPLHNSLNQSTTSGNPGKSPPSTIISVQHDG